MPDNTKPAEIRALERLIFGYTAKEDLEDRLRMLVASMRGHKQPYPKHLYTNIIERIFAEAGYVKIPIVGTEGRAIFDYTQTERRKILAYAYSYYETRGHGGLDEMLEKQKDAEDAMDAMLASARQQGEIEGELQGLNSLIPNYDGVGAIGYQLADGSRISVDARMEQLADQLTTPKNEDESAE